MMDHQHSPGTIEEERHRPWLRKIAQRLIAIVLVVLAGTLLAATLVRFAPGLGTEQQILDSRLSEESLRAIREAHADGKNVLRYYGRYVAGGIWAPRFR